MKKSFFMKLDISLLFVCHVVVLSFFIIPGLVIDSYGAEPITDPQIFLNEISALQEKVQHQQDIIIQQTKSLNEWQKVLQDQQISLSNQQNMILQLQKQLAGEDYQPLPSEQVSQTTKVEKDDSVQVGQQAPETERPELPVLTETGGVLIGKGNLIIEPSFEYTHSSVSHVDISGFSILPAIMLGSLDIYQKSRDSFTTALTMRYGLTNRFEFDVKVPWVYRDDSVVRRSQGEEAYDDTVYGSHGSGLGDIEVGLHYQLNSGRGGWPYLVANLRVKSDTGSDPFDMSVDPSSGLEEELPTGSGFWAFEPSLTWILPIDPAVFYGNISYVWNVKRDVGHVLGEIDPGDSIGFSFGTAIALNDRLSLSLGYDHSFVNKTTINGVDLPGADRLQVGSLVFGTSLKLTEKTSLNISTAIGATRDAPDVQVLVRFPVEF